MDIDELLTKYFEGETTAAEERELRRFFAEGRAPERLKIYQPLFAYFDQETGRARQATPLPEASTPAAGRKVKLFRLLPGAAAALLALVAMGYAFFYAGEGEPDPCLCSANYVVINGRCYTDMQKARSLAFEALREVAAPDDVPFPGIGAFRDGE
jgi:hypothetical protein